MDDRSFTDRNAASVGARDMRRALHSLTEELNAVDAYRCRIDAAGDAELRALLRHHHDEEIAHAAKMLAWLAARDVDFRALRRAGGAAGAPVWGARLTVGSLLGLPQDR